ncbi:glycosyltransferase family 2 protein [Butyrivibrio sp. MC2021]|uniref:glycosyltransferase family 2 protein n=1 Tax=Butyrivibrio sp. MC2021 TaxID=1408306 RepID=UPI00047DDFF0|nr:glycosyltransferase [Butyrivibrio sp. MC2021]
MVSVVIPVYNTEKYLRRCMDALLSQTIDKKNLELVVVNDGSTDSSPEILAEYQEKFPDIVKVYNKTNGGQATARNLGIQKATGEYIGFADSDDYVDPTLFKKLYDKAKQENADLCECHYHSMLEQNGTGADGLPLYKEIGTRGTICAHEDVKELFLNPQVSPWNKLYRREILINNNITFPEGMIYEDTAFYIKTLPFIKKHAYVDEKLVYYCVRANSTMTGNLGRRVGDIFNVFDDIIEFFQRNGLFGQYKDELEYFCVKTAFCSNISRIGRVDSNVMRGELYDKTFSFVIKHFPYYKKNKYFTGKIGMYIKTINRKICPVYGKVLAKVMVG